MPVSLPYWVRDHLHGQTLSLMGAWFQRRSCNGYKPGTLCQRSGQWREDGWKVEEMGWAYLDLARWEQTVIEQYFTCEGSRWKVIRAELRLSNRKFKNILLDLQDAARRRDLLDEEDTELALTARAEGAPWLRERSFSAGRRSCAVSASTSA